MFEDCIDELTRVVRKSLVYSIAEQTQSLSFGLCGRAISKSESTLVSIFFFPLKPWTSLSAAISAETMLKGTAQMVNNHLLAIPFRVL